MSKLAFYQQVKWEYVNSSTYVHGSCIDFSPEGPTQFRNEFMPSGKIIHSWSSGISYTANRRGADLAQLRPNHEYQVEYRMMTHPKETVYIQISFFDLYGHTIETLFIDTNGQSFVVPERMYAYQIALLNVGCRSLSFEEIVINEVTGKGEFDGKFVK